jgi:hypothetical protein
MRMAPEQSRMCRLRTLRKYLAASAHCGVARRRLIGAPPRVSGASFQVGGKMLAIHSNAPMADVAVGTRSEMCAAMYEQIRSEVATDTRSHAE